MKIFKKYGENFNYTEIIELDGAFSTAHINYGKSPIFNNISSKNFAEKSRKNSISSKKNIEEVLKYIYSFDGTEKNLKKEDKILLWKNYWLEYINAFNNLINILPNSIVTIYVGRHAIEIGIKYLLLKKIGYVKNEHNLGILSNLLFEKYDIKDNYMNHVKEFCSDYCEFIEGNNAEYFRYPEYKNNCFFAGNNLDIEWISCNFSLILLKLIHFSNLDEIFMWRKIW
mgnify:CR=1 FL=1